MSINEDFQILAKKLDNCELLTNYNLNVLNEDMMERLLNNIKELAYRMRNTLKRTESIESPDVLASKFVATYDIFEKILTMNK